MSDSDEILRGSIYLEAGTYTREELEYLLEIIDTAVDAATDILEAEEATKH